jgi:hypothetical protein
MAFGCAHPDIAVLEYGVSSDQAKLLRGTTARSQVLCVRPLSAQAHRVLGAAGAADVIPIDDPGCRPVDAGDNLVPVAPAMGERIRQGINGRLS